MENAMFQIREAIGHSQMFFKIGVLKNSVNFTGKMLCWSHFFNKVAGLEKSANLSERDFSMGVFLWNLQIFYKHIFLKKASLVAASKIKKVFDQKIVSAFCYD